MDQQQWDKIESLLNQALTLEGVDRQQAFLKKACKNNWQLYRKTSQILSCIRRAREIDFLERH